MSPPPVDYSSHFGKQLADFLDLPTSIFIPEKSLAYATGDSTEEERRKAAYQMPHSFSTGKGCDQYDESAAGRDIKGSMAEAYLQLNRKFIRGHKEAKLWSRSQSKDLLHRLGIGGTIIVAQVRLEDGTMSKPFGLITGPSVVVPTDLAEDDQYHSTNPGDEPDVSEVPESDWPPAFDPLLISVASHTRPAMHSATSVDSFLSEAALLVAPDVRRYMVYHRLRIETGTIMEAQTAASPIAAAGLWAEDVREKGGRKLVSARQILTDWTGGVTPAPPTAKDPWGTVWQKLPAEEIRDDQSATAQDQHKPRFHLPMVIGEGTVDPSDCTAHPGTLVLRFQLLLPVGHALPVGWVWNLHEISYSTWLNLLAEHVGRAPGKHIQWLAQPYTQAWYAAASSYPEKFAIQLEAFNANFVKDYMARCTGEAEAESNIAHLRLSMFHHLHTDWWLSVISSPRLSKAVLAYQEAALADANASPPGAVDPLLPRHESYYSTTLAVRTRTPTTARWKREYKLGLVQDLAKEQLPIWAQHVHPESCDPGSRPDGGGSAVEFQSQQAGYVSS